MPLLADFKPHSVKRKIEKSALKPPRLPPQTQSGATRGPPAGNEAPLDPPTCLMLKLDTDMIIVGLSEISSGRTQREKTAFCLGDSASFPALSLWTATEMQTKAFEETLGRSIHIPSAVPSLIRAGTRYTTPSPSNDKKSDLLLELLTL